MNEDKKNLDKLIIKILKNKDKLLNHTGNTNYGLIIFRRILEVINFSE